MSTAIVGYKIGYARVSTLEQDESLQRDALTTAGCEKIFVDKASGKLDHRPGLDSMLEQMRAGDSVVVWRLDRLGRSLRNLIDLVSELEARGVGFVSVTESIDSTTPGGKLIFHIFGALAEFERDLIRERTMAGLAAARARGRRGGRKPLSPQKVQQLRTLAADKKNAVGEICKTLGISRATFYR